MRHIHRPCPPIWLPGESCSTQKKPIIPAGLYAPASLPAHTPARLPGTHQPASTQMAACPLGTLTEVPQRGPATSAHPCGDGPRLPGAVVGKASSGASQARRSRASLSMVRGLPTVEARPRRYLRSGRGGEAGGGGGDGRQAEATQKHIPAFLRAVEIPLFRPSLPCRSVA